MADDVGRIAIFPGGARLVEQRSLAQQVEEFVALARQRHLERIAGLALVRFRRAASGIGEAGRVTQQILQSEVMRRRHEPEIAAFADADLHAGELRQIFARGIAEQKSSFLVEHEQRDRGHHFRHRGDGENRVGRHRRAARGIAQADGLAAGDLAASRHHRDRAGDAFFRDLSLQRGSYAREAVGGEADVFGFADGAADAFDGGHGASLFWIMVGESAVGCNLVPLCWGGQSAVLKHDVRKALPTHPSR